MLRKRETNMALPKSPKDKSLWALFLSLKIITVSKLRTNKRKDKDMKFIKIFNLKKERTELINTKEIAFIATTKEGQVGLYQTVGDLKPWVVVRESIEELYQELNKEE